MESSGWSAVRCVIRTSAEGGGGVYEERITLWDTPDLDEAIARAEREAREYASPVDEQSPRREHLGFAQAFRLFDEVGPGAEVFSLLRDSDLPPQRYLDTFFATGGEHETTDPPQPQAVYERYIAILNARRWEDLADVVHDEISHDGRAMTREQFADLLREDVATIPDLHYEVRALVVSGDHLAARLWFDCTPARPFRGVDTGGRRVAFAEHAFYRLADGRIRTVESVVDVDAVRRQVRPG